MIRTALCDADRAHRKRICAMLKGVQLSVSVTEYDSVEALLWDMETDGIRYELYCLPAGDEKPVERLRGMDAEALLIFLTGDGAARMKAHDAGVMGCLKRPVEEGALRALLVKAAERLRRDKRRVVVITQRNRTQMLRFEDIEYISSANHILRFYLRGGKEQTCYGRLDQVADQLDPELFVRCHQSHVVNLSRVTEYTSKLFRMSSGAVIPISRSHALQAHRALKEYLFHIPSVSEEGS